MIDLILGTAGHIDHGKTALVKALTGIDTDRLPEEKRRGITIDLGFAEMVLGQYRLGIVDVPGHERFVRNMLAGATGIDLALLVVAADDSVKPQTREHVHILGLLERTTGVIALTKCDLPEPDWIDLVEAEVRELVAGTFLADAPVVRTSAVTGQGLEALREALLEAAERAAQSPQRHAQGPFRMAIDRAFTVAGHGTVVTGSVLRGRARIGEELRIEPGAIPVRVRGLENHGRGVEEIHRGQRAAINLAGVHHEALDRGQELCTPGYLAPSRLLSVRLELLGSAPRPLKVRSRVRLHLGTAELMASVGLLDCDELRPGESAMAQLFLARPAVATWNQPFVVRSESPVATIGGGQVLEPVAARLHRKDSRLVARLADLASPDPLARAAAAILMAGWRRWQPGDLVRAAGIGEPESVCRLLLQRGDLVALTVAPGRERWLHRDVVRELKQRIETVLRRLHEQAPLQASFDRGQVVGHFRSVEDDALVESLLNSLAGEGRIVVRQRALAASDHGPRLSDRERETLEKILEIYRQAEYQPPAVEQLKEQIGRSQAVVPDLLQLAVAQKRLVRVSAEVYLHADAETRMRQTLAERMSGGKALTVSQIREILGTTRKYAVPFCEYLDRTGFTRREGDLRVLQREGGNEE